MSRLPGAVLLCLAGYGLGEYLYRKALLRQACLLQGIALTEWIGDGMKYLSSPPAELLQDIYRAGVAPHYLAGIPSSFRNIRIPDCYTAAEREAWQRFLGGLGHLPLEQEQKRLDGHSRWLQSLLRTQERSCEQARRLYRQIGLCAGVAFAILLW